jgi:hypothetical protein
VSAEDYPEDWSPFVVANYQGGVEAYESAPQSVFRSLGLNFSRHLCPQLIGSCLINGETGGAAEHDQSQGWR